MCHRFGSSTFEHLGDAQAGVMDNAGPTERHPGPILRVGRSAHLARLAQAISIVSVNVSLGFAALSPAFLFTNCTLCFCPALKSEPVVDHLNW